LSHSLEKDILMVQGVVIIYFLLTNGWYDFLLLTFKILSK